MSRTRQNSKTVKKVMEFLHDKNMEIIIKRGPYEGVLVGDALNEFLCWVRARKTHDLPDYLSGLGTLVRRTYRERLKERNGTKANFDCQT